MPEPRVTARFDKAGRVSLNALGFPPAPPPPTDKVLPTAASDPEKLAGLRRSLSKEVAKLDVIVRRLSTEDSVLKATLESYSNPPLVSDDDVEAHRNAIQRSSLRHAGQINDAHGRVSLRAARRVSIDLPPKPPPPTGPPPPVSLSKASSSRYSLSSDDHEDVDD